MTDNNEVMKSMGSKGGKNAAKNMTPEERKARGKMGAAARWGKVKSEGIIQATHAGTLNIGDIVIPCAVLEDGTRVLTQEGFFKAIGRSGKPAAGRGSQVEKVAPFLDLDNLKPFVDMELADSTKPIVFRVSRGARAYGYKAELLPRVCEVYLKAREAGALLKTQERFAQACEILVRGLAHVGIIALVDEATGFQDVRAHNALAEILEAFVAKELRKWVRTFPVDFYKELFRLRNLHYSENVKKPAYIGHLTNDLVYARLAPGVLDELKHKNPVTERGYRRNKHHQWLTEDIGHPKLLQHLSSVIALMRAFDAWEEFKQRLDRALPKQLALPLFDDIEGKEPISD